MTRLAVQNTIPSHTAHYRPLFQQHLILEHFIFLSMRPNSRRCQHGPDRQPAVSPNTGPIAGGTSVTITGTNFTGATAVSFGGTAAAGFSVVSATSITATSPAHAAGAVDVTVTTPSGTSATSASDTFTYAAAPTVAGVSPNTGPAAGGTSVTITGTNFTGATAVSFGGTAAASFAVVSATSITATSPAHAAGAVDVTVTTPNGTSATSASDTFTYAVADTVPPTVPTNLTATAISSTQINLTWTASTDNVGVTGYQIFRNGVQVGTSATNSYSDTGLTASTTYTYTVSAYDAAGNVSAQSSAASATTLAPSTGTPTLIQHVASSANPVGVGISGNNFKIPLPNSVGSGNALILGITLSERQQPDHHGQQRQHLANDSGRVRGCRPRRQHFVDLGPAKCKRWSDHDHGLIRVSHYSIQLCRERV